MSPFPAPWPVQHQKFVAPTTAESGETIWQDELGNDTVIDELGNDDEEWDDPVEVKVIAYQPSSVENITGYTSRVVSDIDMAVPPELEVSVRDRFILPGETIPFNVVAIEDACHGFHQWAPGNIVKLQRVTG